MKCNSCKSKLKVIATLPYDTLNIRIRQCLNQNCKKIFETIEHFHSETSVVENKILDKKKEPNQN